MTKDSFNTPVSRTWRDIPQPVKPRAMSRGGRWRLARATLRTMAGVAAAAVVGWGGWKVAAVVHEDSRMMPAAVKSVPLRAPELSTTGVLGPEWLARTLALPKKFSLMEIDLELARARVLADPQVLTATLTRHPPNRLAVAITEREPVARVMADWRGVQQSLLVARDGVVFAGEGHDPALTATLPWLHGVKLVRDGERFRPLPGMATATDLLTTAQLHAPWLYEQWHVLSLAKLPTDRELEVRTAQGVTVVFGTGLGTDFFRQLVKLDFLLTEFAARGMPAPGRIDLSLGSAVPVMLPTAAAAENREAGAVVARPSSSLLSPLPSRTIREL